MNDDDSNEQIKALLLGIVIVGLLWWLLNVLLESLNY